MVRRACEYLRSLDRFSVAAEISYDEALVAGYKLQYSRAGRLLVERRTVSFRQRERQGLSHGLVRRRVADDLRRGSERLRDLEAPDTIDATLDLIADRGIVMPLDDLLYSEPCAGLGEHVQSGYYVGLNYVDGGFYHHVLLATDAVDVQLWVEDDETPLICKVVITYGEELGEPQFMAILRDWNRAPAPTPADFVFTPPAGAHSRLTFRGRSLQGRQGTMSLRSRKRQAPTTAAHVVLAVTLVVAPGPLPLLWGADDTALARDRGGGGARGARAGKSRSAIERAPRSASAATGSVRQANRGGGQPQLSERRDVARAERRPATAAPERQRPAERTAVRESERAPRGERQDERTAGTEARREERSAGRGERQDERTAGTEGRRDERSERAEARRAEAEGRRGDRAAGLEEGRDQRSEALQDLQENRRDLLEALQEDRQESIEDLADEREELWRKCTTIATIGTMTTTTTTMATSGCGALSAASPGAWPATPSAPP